MPIYEYQCTACGHKMEKIQKLSDKPLIDCPACEQAELKKLVSAAAFRLKGDGWYETDFKTGAKKNVLHSADSAKDSKSSASSSSNDANSSSGSTSSDSKKGRDTTKSSSSGKTSGDSSKSA